MSDIVKDEIVSFPGLFNVHGKDHQNALELTGKSFYVAENIQGYMDRVESANSFVAPALILSDFNWAHELMYCAYHEDGFAFLQMVPIVLITSPSNKAIDNIGDRLNVIGTFSIYDQSKPEEFQKLLEAFETVSRTRMGLITAQAFQRARDSVALKPVATGHNQPVAPQLKHT